MSTNKKVTKKKVPTTKVSSKVSKSPATKEVSKKTGKKALVVKKATPKVAVNKPVKKDEKKTVKKVEKIPAKKVETPRPAVANRPVKVLKEGAKNVAKKLPSKSTPKVSKTLKAVVVKDKDKDKAQTKKKVVINKEKEKEEKTKEVIGGPKKSSKGPSNNKLKVNANKDKKTTKEFAEDQIETDDELDDSFLDGDEEEGDFSGDDYENIENAEGEEVRRNKGLDDDSLDEDEEEDEKSLVLSPSPKFSEHEMSDDLKDLLTDELTGLSDDYSFHDIFLAMRSLDFFKEESDECIERGCDNPATTAGYCRYHYIVNWREIKRKQEILQTGKLQDLIESVVARYPAKIVKNILADLGDEKTFFGVLKELNIESSDSFDDVDGEDDDGDIAFETKGLEKTFEEEDV